MSTTEEYGHCNSFRFKLFEKGKVEQDSLYQYYINSPWQGRTYLELEGIKLTEKTKEGNKFGTKLQHEIDGQILEFFALKIQEIKRYSTPVATSAVAHKHRFTLDKELQCHTPTLPLQENMCTRNVCHLNFRGLGSGIFPRKEGRQKKGLLNSCSSSSTCSMQ